MAGEDEQFPSIFGGDARSDALALAKNPKLLLCDEPTGALDYKTGKSVLKLLQEMARTVGMTVVIITHNTALSPSGDRVIRMKSGIVEAVVKNPSPKSVNELEW